MHPPQHALERLPVAESPFTRVATLLVVGAIGAVAFSATADPARSAALTPTSVTSTLNADRALVRTPGKPATAAAGRSTAQHPRAVQHSSKPAAKHAVAPTRYVPAGTGMWLYEWRRSNHGNAGSIVHRAQQAGLSTLYLRTGSSWDGFNGGAHLRQLLAASRGTGVHVVAWDFPRLRHPQHDAQRLARAARIRTASGLHVSAVAPDIETPNEGTFNASWRVSAYLRALRRELPADVSILTAVPWPSRYRIADYPYGTVARHSDVLVPMAYWYNNRPTDVTARSIGYLRRFHRPVQPVGQGYDGRLDVPGIRHNNLSRQVPAFFWTAHKHGARAVSLWSWQAAPPVAWHALVRAHRLFPARH